MTETTLSIVIMVIVLLVPAIPAFFLFKYLPSTGDVTGPWHGLQLRLGGAFAGYVIVVLIAVQIRPQELQHYHTWTVAGSIATKPALGDPDPNINDIVIRIVPPRLSIMNQGSFEWEIPVIEDAAGRLQFPLLQIDLPGYRGVTLPLGPTRTYGAIAADATYDESNRLIYIKTPITLESKKSVQAYAPAIAPTATPDDRNTAAAAAAASTPAGQ